MTGKDSFIKGLEEGSEAYVNEKIANETIEAAKKKGTINPNAELVNRLKEDLNQFLSLDVDEQDKILDKMHEQVEELNRQKEEIQTVIDALSAIVYDEEEEEEQEQGEGEEE